MAQSSELSPTKIFARIESLKKWQMEQQQRLLQQQSQQSKFLSNEQKRLHEALGNQQSVIETSECDTPERNKQGLVTDDSSFDEYSDEETIDTNDMSGKHLDEIPIKTTMKNFTSLLEEKLKANDAPVLNRHAKPKRTYLKKGAGLSRFRMTLTDLAHNKPKPKIAFTKKRTTSYNKQEPKSISHIGDCFENNKHINNNSKRTSNNKKSTATKNGVTGVSLNTENLQMIRNNNDLTGNRVTETPKIKYTEPKTTWKSVSENKPSDYQSLIAELIQVRQRNPALFDSPINTSSESNQLFHHELPDELKMFEILEQKASNSSFCSTSSLATKFIQQPIRSTPRKKLNFALLTSGIPEENLPDEQISSIPKRTVTFSDRAVQHESESEDGINEHIRDRDSSDSESSSDTNSSINSDDVYDMNTVVPSNCPNAGQKNTIVFKDCATNTDQPIISSELLKTRLEQLETELNTFRLENARVSKIKSQLETDTRNFEKRKRLLDKETEEQQKQLKAQIDEERAKLAKERSIYDKYIREIKEGKSVRQKERDELNTLKSRLTSIEQEMKLKESKWGATQARIRSQLKNLEKENASLRTENNELRIKNGKLEATNKQLLNRRPSDTKILHEINKNISKLTQESLEKQTSEKKTKKMAETPKRTKPSPSRHRNTPSPKQIQEDKENNRNSLNSTSDSKSSTDHSFESVEREYERLFGKVCSHEGDENMKLPVAEASSCSDTSGRREETVLEDGSVRIAYPNGNVKTVSADGQLLIMQYHNGDVKETCKTTGSIRYFYSDAKTWHTTFPDGTELLEFSNGQIEKRFANGASEILFPNGCHRCSSPSGTEEVAFPDGTMLVTRTSTGEKILKLPNGQKEVHTKDHKRREYPDGTVKLLYPDGVQETRYANGRIRLKDKQGNLIMDSATV